MKLADGDDEEDEEKSPGCPSKGSMIDVVVVPGIELKQLEVVAGSVETEGVDQEVVANCRHSAPVCHIDGK